MGTGPARSHLRRLRAAALAGLILLLPASGQARLETLRWRDPNPAPSPVVSFRVHIGPSSRNYVTSFDVGLPPADPEGVRSVTAEVPDDATLYVAMTSFDAEGRESAFSNEQVRAPNQPPDGSIDAPTGTVTITVGQTVSFAGSASDPDGELPLTYAWDFEAARSGVAPLAVEDPGPLAFLTAGTFTVRLTVTDAAGLSDPTPAAVTVIVEPPPAPPAPNQPPDGRIDTPTGAVTIAVGETVTFAGSGWDPDSELPVAYAWDFEAARSGVAPLSVEDPGPVLFSVPGTFAVQLSVRDAAGLSDPTPASMTVVVESSPPPSPPPAPPPPPSQPPDGRIDAPTGPVTITVGQTVSFAGSGFDPDGELPLAYAWDFEATRSGVAPLAVEDPGPVAFLLPGTFTVALTVRDDAGLSDPSPASISVVVEPLAPPPGRIIADVEVDVELVASGFDDPVYLTAPQGDPRLFVVEAGGAIRILDGEQVLPDPFLDLSLDVSSAPEGGLLGLAFASDYAETGLFYVHRIDLQGDSVLSRFRVSEDPDQADAESEEELLRVAQPFEGQNGAMITFGPDGFLYLGLGDGGSVNDPGNRAQDGLVLLGKLLRLDVAVPPRPTSIAIEAGYAIPADNPFVGDPAVRDEIWAIGLRNPYRFSFDRQLGDLWIADEGQEAREEVNFESRESAGGLNYGWDVMEGSLCNETDPAPEPACEDPSLVLPFHEYADADGDCAITGGYVYRGMSLILPDAYFFGDFCSGRIWSLDRATGARVDWTLALAPAAGVPSMLVSFGEGGNGDLYALHLSGQVYRLGEAAPACSDGLDNDGDGFVDFPEDPGCRDTAYDLEAPSCNDGLDNDGDGLADAEDPECEVPWWDDEATSCGLGAELTLLLPILMQLYRRRLRKRGVLAAG